MLTYTIRRAAQAVLALFGISLIVFIIIHVSGDPAILLLPPDATLQDVEELRKHMGLDKPLWIQYFTFLSDAIHGDFGMSFRRREPAMQVVLEHLPNTVKLAALSLCIATLIAIPLGIIAAVYVDSWIDIAAVSIAVIGQSMPVFWLGILLIFLFNLKLGWLPAGGMGGFGHYVLPAITLGWYTSALLTRVTRTSVLEVLNEDYVTTARAKGLKETVVILKHVLKNAGIPIVTLWGLQLGTALRGSVVAETVFGWPGVGRLSILAVLGRDFPVVLAVVVVLAIVFITANFLVDLVYCVLDPRIRYD